MFRVVARLMLAAATVLLAAPADAFIPIDDFEIGSFFLSAGANCDAEIVVLNSYNHSISGNRQVTLCAPSQGTSAAAWLYPGSQLDDAVLYSAYSSTAASFLRFRYEWLAPTDMTFGGSRNRIEVELEQIIPSGLISVEIWDPSGSSSITRFTTSTGVQQFLLSAFNAIDATQVTAMEVEFWPDGKQGTYEIADIRLRGRAVAGSSFGTLNLRGDFVDTQWPPIPSPPLSFRALNPGGDTLYRSDIAVTNADAGFVPSMRADWEETAALGGEIAGMNFWWLQQASYVDTRFEISVDLSTAGGYTPEIAFPPAPIYDGKSILLDFLVVLTDNAGNEVGNSETRLVLDVHEGQALRFEDVQVIAGSAKLGTSDGFLISFALKSTGNVDEGEALFEATWAGDWAPGVTTDVGSPSLAGAPSTLSLVAAPTVTRDATEFRMSHALTRRGALEVFDAAGRLVQRLDAAAGSSAVTWDGRGGDGAKVASGVYWARLADDPSRATARVVLVR